MIDSLNTQPLEAPLPPTFTPVPSRKPRHDGWTPERQRRFVAALARLGNVGAASRAVGMSATSAYNLRKRPGAQGFAAAWDDALEEASDRALAAAVERSQNGITLARLYRGRFIGTIHRFDNRDLLRALSALERRQAAQS